MENEDRNIVRETEDELLPLPEESAAVSPDMIPAPEEEDEYLEDISDEVIREEMIGVDEDGYTRCLIVADLSKIENFDPAATPIGADLPEEFDGSINELPDDRSIPIRDVQVKYCTVKEYTLDGNVVNIELTFDNKYDKDMSDLLDILDEYAEMNGEFDKAYPGTGDLPIFSLSFMPLNYPGQGMATYMQPFAYFKTLPHDSEEEKRIVHMLFPIERTGIQIFHTKKEDIDNLREYYSDRERNDDMLKGM